MCQKEPSGRFFTCSYALNWRTST